MTSRHLIIIISFIISSCSSKSEDQNDLFVNNQVTTFQKRSESQRDSSIFYLQKADKLIELYPEKISDSLKIENRFLKGMHYFQLGKLDSASKHLYNTIESINDTIYSKRNVTYFNETWNVHLQLGEYGECVAISKKFKDLLDRKNKIDRALAYYQLTVTYHTSGDYKNALANNDIQINLLKEVKDTIGLIAAQTLKASIHYHYLNDKQRTFGILDTLLLNEHLLHEQSKRDIHSDYGYYLHVENDLLKAREHYLKGLKALKKTNDNQLRIENEVIAYANLGELHLDLKEYEMAIKYLDSALLFENKYIPRRTYRNILNYKLRYAFETQSDLSVVQRQLNNLLDFQNKDYENKYEKDLKSLETSYANEKHLSIINQQAELENLKLRIRQIVIFLSSLLFISIGYVFYRRRRYHFQKESLQMQQRLLRSQMNPHFTFNTLYAIQNTIKINQQGAIDYLLKFSRLLRLILENSVHNYIPLEKELESLRKYMDLQLLRFPNKFEYSIEINEQDSYDENDDEFYIPPMLIQPFIENSIEHGFQGITHKGLITISLLKENKYLHCRIEDNGKGITEMRNKRVSSTQLISHFIEKTTKRKIKTINKNDMDSSQSGLTIEFLIPYKYVADD